MFPPLPRHIIDLRIHVVRGLDHLRIRFVSARREYHLDELGHDVHVGVLEISLLQGAQTLSPARIAKDWVTRTQRGLEEVRTDALKTAGIGKRSQLKLT